MLSRTDLIKWGLLMGGLTTALSFGFYLYDRPLVVHSPWMGSLQMAANLILLVVLARRLQKQQNGYLPFKQGWRVLLLPAMVSSSLHLLWLVLLFHVFDRDLAPAVHQAMLDKIDAMGNDSRVTNEQIVQLKKMAEHVDLTPVKGWRLILQIAGVPVGSAIFAAIAAAVVRKEKPQAVAQ